MEHIELNNKVEGVNYDINDRWEKGVPHHPESVKLYKRLAEIDFAVGSDYFCFKAGGDGDNGERWYIGDKSRYPIASVDLQFVTLVDLPEDSD